MKLRFRHNSLRLRLNRLEVRELAAGRALSEAIFFPGDNSFCYELKPAIGKPGACFKDGGVVVTAPDEEIRVWAHSDAIGIYFELPADKTQLRVAIEKDLECLDGPLEERDPDAFPRGPGESC